MAEEYWLCLFREGLHPEVVDGPAAHFDGVTNMLIEFGQRVRRIENVDEYNREEDAFFVLKITRNDPPRLLDGPSFDTLSGGFVENCLKAAGWSENEIGRRRDP